MLTKFCADKVLAFFPSGAYLGTYLTFVFALLPGLIIHMHQVMILYDASQGSMSQ